MREDEIQILGMEKPRKIRRIIIGIICLFFIATIIVYFCIWERPNINVTENNYPSGNMTEEVSDVYAKEEAKINVLFEDGFMGVPLRIIQPANMFALLTHNRMEYADTMGERPLLAVEIGDTYSQKRNGYCAIVNGQVTIGEVDEEDDIRDFCMAKNGFYFQQYPLVIEGQRYEYKTKGKALRRALAKEDDYVYIIESEKEELIDDFASAIVALGVSDAICLPSPPCFLSIHSKECDYETGKNIKNCSYLIFKPIDW